MSIYLPYFPAFKGGKEYWSISLFFALYYNFAKFLAFLLFKVVTILFIYMVLSILENIRYYFQTITFSKGVVSNVNI